ncbi:hypothetical protein ACQEU8_16010 [Streptomyces sp. CA-250714]|uniref:hypothetical protein n=1 Tax=Streptomyces sp. CA-250714 TaxID=3240060 RepID=UPI003D8C79F3
MRGLLGALGFTRTGRHPVKPVELWEQGEARIVLNTAGADRRSGLAPTALGLEASDPEAEVRRAESLRAFALPRRPAPREAPLEAVAAPDGTELFFRRTGDAERPDWRGDFAPTPSPAPGSGARPCGVTRIDHVALTQPWRHVDDASLFIRACWVSSRTRAWRGPTRTGCSAAGPWPTPRGSYGSP